MWHYFRDGAGDPMSADRRVVQQYFAVTLRGDGIVVLERLPEPYATLADLHRAYDEFLAAVDDWLFDQRVKQGHIGTRARVPMSWLYDVRNAPSQRNDPAFEAAIRERRADLMQRSPLLVIVARTRAGQMQLDRMAREARTQLQVSSSFEEAEAWLLQQMPLAFAQTS
jgi:hypothetical protein